jgi:hypothetical protein
MRRSLERSRTEVVNFSGPLPRLSAPDRFGPSGELVHAASDSSPRPAMSTSSQHPSRTRREFLRTVVVTAAGLGVAAVAGAQTRTGGTNGAPAPITVYKDPNCGCCANWVKHLRAAGFVVTVRDTADMSTVKAAMGVPTALQSCHTARVGTYVIEGHVPADLIQKVLQEKPVGLGLAVPGMPVGSPGMEGGTPEKYDIMLFDRAGKARVYASRG